MARTDVSFTMANLNSRSREFLQNSSDSSKKKKKKKRKKKKEKNKTKKKTTNKNQQQLKNNKYLGKFSYFIMLLYVVCTH